MSTLAHAAKAVRPRLHFTPRRGWINDPNGLIVLDGIYHMFYQYDPDGIVHGPMHWGHASSMDLVNWSEHPVALAPDASGQCFSGSAILASDGNVGQGLKAHAEGVLLFYTAHLPREGRPGLQTQCLAMSGCDLGIFERFSRNPVIDNPGITDFRDPKVIWHAASQRWIMVVTHGQSVGLYSSPDALAWRFESEFGAGEGAHGSGPWECPDLFPICSGEGREHWILVVGLGDGHPAGGSGTQYFVGGFDGSRFVNDNLSDQVLWLDHGRDFYAAQSFAGQSEEAPLIIAWMNNWDYAQDTPAVDYRGSMTLPRRLSLVETSRGLRLRQHIDPAVADAFPLKQIDLRVRGGELTWIPETPCYRFHLCVGDFQMGDQLGIALFGEDQPQILIENTSAGVCIRFRRTSYGVTGRRGRFDCDIAVTLPSLLDVLLQIFIDSGLVECSLGHGVDWFSMQYFPADPSGRLCVSLNR